ncbi:MAG TPA: DUF6461 domain-containing protein [Geodermatophilus sp.]|nr:DUF6461 domain-containing protein [Geodermatophilus sp.]
MTSRYSWFADWVDNHVMATLTAVKGPDAARVLAVFGSTGFDQSERTLYETFDLETPTIRIGTTAGGWLYAVEQRTVKGGDHALLQRLTSDGGEAVALCFTPKIDVFHYCKNGEHILGFDILIPDFRYGSEQQALDQQMHEAGLLTRDGPRPRAAVADFVERVFGLTITRSMLEDRLPCATIPP